MVTSFHEVQFPPDIAYGASGGPEYATDVVVVESGHEQRNVRWAEARGKWDVASGVKNRAHMDALIAFFRARKGRAHGFRFKDWSDYQASNQMIGTGDGASVTFQLAKVYQSGGITETRTITKPVAGTVTVMIVGIAQTSRWAVDTTTGLVTFSANVSRLIAGISNASPCVVTTTVGHGLSTGDSVHLSGIQGMTQLNGRRFVITRINSTSFSLNGVDATGYGAWTTGGAVNTIPQA
ncbi:MAG: TIGR02217 family protein, partial [Alphaproteobacteria bacterium]